MSVLLNCYCSWVVILQSYIILWFEQLIGLDVYFWMSTFNLYLSRTPPDHNLRFLFLPLPKKPIGVPANDKRPNKMHKLWL